MQTFLIFLTTVQPDTATTIPSTWSILAPWLSAAGVAAITGAAGWFTARAVKPGSREMALVVQLQADGAALRQELATLRAEVAVLRDGQDADSIRHLVVVSYAFRLRTQLEAHHITPLDWPIGHP